MGASTSQGNLSKPGSGAPAAAQLQQIVRVSEHIKHIVATAFTINLMAYNAIFLANRAGDSARGFGVLSNELRRFAVDLAQAMSTLRELTNDSVIIVSRRLRRLRTLESLSGLRVRGTLHGQAALDLAVDRQVSVLRAIEEQLGSRQRALQVALVDIRQQIDLGGVLARSAKVEAAYGGSFAEALAQVSNEFDRTVESIRQSLDSLCRT